MYGKVTSKSSNKKQQWRTKRHASSRIYEKDVTMFASRNSRKSVVKIEAPDDEVTNFKHYLPVYALIINYGLFIYDITKCTGRAKNCFAEDKRRDQT